MLIAQMVGRNEANRYLEGVLERLRTQVDLICFTDDCSSDDTLEMARCYATTQRTSEPLFGQHEGRLRRFAWELVEQNASPGDWILAIDCDEELYNLDQVQDELDGQLYHALGVMFYHMWDELNYRNDKAWKPSVATRLFRFQPDAQFLDKALACGSSPTYVQRVVSNRYLRDNPLVMKHMGYMAPQDKAAKYERYMALDGGRFHAASHIRSILDPRPRLVPWKSVAH